MHITVLTTPTDISHNGFLLLSLCGSFRGGDAGPSQEQVYEAMQIFGEGIQDFDFMKPIGDDEGGEVRKKSC